MEKEKICVLSFFFVCTILNAVPIPRVHIARGSDTVSYEFNMGHFFDPVVWLGTHIQRPDNMVLKKKMKTSWFVVGNKKILPWWAPAMRQSKAKLTTTTAATIVLLLLCPAMTRSKKTMQMLCCLNKRLMERMTNEGAYAADTRGLVRDKRLDNGCRKGNLNERVCVWVVDTPTVCCCKERTTAMDRNSLYNH